MGLEDQGIPSGCCHVGAGYCQGTSVPQHVGSSPGRLECPHGMAAGFSHTTYPIKWRGKNRPAGRDEEREEGENEEEATMPFMAKPVTHHHFYGVLFLEASH